MATNEPPARYLTKDRHGPALLRHVPVRRLEGSTSVMVAVVVVVLVGFLALVVDLGTLYRTRGELQTAADAAALAGAQELDRTAAGVARARDAARTWAGQNRAFDAAVALLDEDVVFGHWDESTRTFTPLGTHPPDPAAVNAVEVTGRRVGARGTAVPMTFARVLGITELDVSGSGVAVGGGPASECGFPMVVPDCSLETPVASGTCDYCMQFQDNNTDNAGWTSFGTSAVSGPVIRNLVEGACFDSSGAVAVDPTTLECTGACNEVDVGTEIRLQNGNLMNTGNNNFCPTIQQVLTRGISGGTPEPFVVTVPVLQSTGSGCDAAQFSGTKNVAGFATMEILGARCGSADPGVFVPAAPCSPPPSDKYIMAVLRCDRESMDVAGGGYFGLDATRVRLVR